LLSSDTSTIYTIGAHAAGEPCRIIDGRAVELHGRTLQEKRDHWQTKYDWLRTALMQEPRGHKGMFGAVITPPIVDESDYGLIFMDPVGYLDGCGHATLCSVAVWRRMNGNITAPFKIDNADGTSTCVVDVEGDGEYATTTLLMPTADVIREQVQIGECLGGLVHCGNNYLLVDSSQVGIPDLQNATTTQLREAAVNLLQPALDRFSEYESLEIALYRTLDIGESYANAVVFNEAQIDRSPCGTGSSSLVSLLLHRGKIDEGERVQTIGPAGESFELEVKRAHSDDERSASYKVRMKGTAYITGEHEWTFHQNDPLCKGFTLR